MHFFFAEALGRELRPRRRIARQRPPAGWKHTAKASYSALFLSKPKQCGLTLEVSACFLHAPLFIGTAPFHQRRFSNLSQRRPFNCQPSRTRYHERTPSNNSVPYRYCCCGIFGAECCGLTGKPKVTSTASGSLQATTVSTARGGGSSSSVAGGGSRGVSGAGAASLPRVR